MFLKEIMMNNTAFITGATSGFGEAAAKALAKDGFKLILLGRRKNRLEALKQELKDTEIYIICADIRNKDIVFDEIDKIPDKFKDIEILVNNAGLALSQDVVSKASIDDFEIMIDTNIKGLLYVTKAVLPIMIKRKSGYIFNISSTAARWPYTGGNVYGATKAFVAQFNKNLRTDIRGSGIRVTEIAPGLAKTEFSLVRFKGDKSKSEAVYEGTDYLRAEDIAKIISDCIKLPKRININTIEVMPVTQSWGGLFVER